MAAGATTPVDRSKLDMKAITGLIEWVRVQVAAFQAAHPWERDHCRTAFESEHLQRHLPKEYQV